MNCLKNQFYPFFRFFCLVGVPLWIFSSCNEEETSPTPPNILIIISDDQGWGDLSVNGNPSVRTPRIDAMAEAGVQFTRFYVSPVCSPTRAELLTGRYHPRGGIYDTSSGGERLDLDETTVAEIFQSEGYRTGAFGKWHNGTQPPYHPNNRGFEEYYGFASGHWGNYFSPMLERNGEVVQGDGFIIDDLTNQTLKFIEKESNQPFFAWLALNTPHSPMQVPDLWWERYKNDSIPPHRYQDSESPDKTRAAWALCENIDWNVGRILDRLDSLGKLENTIVIYMSDNGPNGWRWNDGLKGIKGHTDEGGVRSPFIVFWKDHLQAKKIHQVAATIDVLPSLVDMAGISMKENKKLDGVSLKPLLMGEDQDWEERFIFSHWNGAVSVRNQDYLLDKEDRLFDLKNDPGQLEPIINPSDSLQALFVEAKANWKNKVLSELDRNRREVFPIGYSKSTFTHLPARDGIAHGSIQRSNRFPNSSFFTNWISESDSITWDAEVLTSDNYKATIYYIAKESAVGSIISLEQGENQLEAPVLIAHDPPFVAVEYDRYPRQESYEKNFRPLELGVIHLDEGVHSIALKSKKINGPEFIEVRLLVLEKLDE